MHSCEDRAIGTRARRERLRPVAAASIFVAIAAAIGSLLLAVPAIAAAEWGVAELMQALARRGAERALFVEKKYIAILDQPLESSGELRYTPPDRLEKRTLKPKPETVVFEGDRLALERGSFKRTLRISDYPGIAAFVDSIRGALGGDRKSLEHLYRLELHGNQERWTLVMLPSDPGMAALVLRIDIGGMRDRVRAIEILQADGDRSVMTIEPIARATGAAGAAGAAGTGAAEKARSQ